MDFQYGGIQLLIEILWLSRGRVWLYVILQFAYLLTDFTWYQNLNIYVHKALLIPLF